MTFPDVLKRGDEFLKEYPRQSRMWRFLSYSTCLITLGFSKLIMSTFYNVKVNNLDKLQDALKRAEKENRGIMTIMNHMSTVDDPTFWAAFPWKLYNWNPDNVRWCLGAENICFSNKLLGYFFSLGQVLSTKRFGVGPFQGSIDASIRLLSPDDTINMNWTPWGQVKEYFAPAGYQPPVKRNKPAWVHVYPEGFVLQLHPPYANSMRYFKWGITRMVLEATRPPIVVPIFTTGFENIINEGSKESFFKQIWKSIGTEINVTIGDPLDDSIINLVREEWDDLVKKFYDPEKPTDLSTRLKYGEEAQQLRSKVAAILRDNVAKIRDQERKFPPEDPRFKSPAWWKRFTTTEGKSDPDVKFIGQNWAIRRLQTFLNIDEKKKHNEGKNEEKPNRKEE
ncbi:hypothetical protein NCAS_0F03460 [Naumovozyma castellii]|uniref:Tafazzin family protein n=1 Tax=Naumovozyma castellii TaxID=27288 RepID=G0VH57_NAUCA|nr:hypothetical protein NCAS_0F03460 [Naumovozyma castellii CBS 4309]CCC70830.1 hypothetical protein NCAS_0F03460 [Naumovozyma castellii CBS 4309]